MPFRNDELEQPLSHRGLQRNHRSPNRDRLFNKRVGSLARNNQPWMKRAVWVFCIIASLCISVGGVALGDATTGKPITINASGTFQDKGVWLYRNADGKFGFGPATIGTNELLVMPSPSPPSGGAVAGVEIIRHPFDTLGYPLHIALVEKLFAASYQTEIMVSNSRDELWKYAYGDPVTNEKPALGLGSRPTFKAWGPFPGNAVPISQAPEQDIQAAFNFAKSALNSISNMPQTQKDLANYGVLFADDGSTIWVELGPRFAPNETPHLGCQTQLGRDMVFGFDKKQPDKQGFAGKFLQCF